VPETSADPPIRATAGAGRAQELYAGRTQCRASSHLLDVMPDGRIFPCPDLPYEPGMVMGERPGP